MNDLSPVIAGLAVGIAFVVLFSMMFKLASFVLSDKELIAKYSELAEVRYFIEKYPDAKAEVIRTTDENSVEIVYSVERQAEQPSGLSAGVNTLGLHVYTRPNLPLSLGVSCGVHEGLIIGWGYADNGSIDGAEETCFDGEYPEVSPDMPRYPVQ